MEQARQRLRQPWPCFSIVEMSQEQVRTAAGRLADGLGFPRACLQANRQASRSRLEVSGYQEQYLIHQNVVIRVGRHSLHHMPLPRSTISSLIRLRSSSENRLRKSTIIDGPDGALLK
jgi:hypothetical protein